MTSYVITPPVETLLPVEGGGQFPVRRIYCVGQNYADHAREMGGDPDRQPPFFFSKPRDAVTAGSEVSYPPATQNLHHEVELVLALGSGGANLSPEAALSLVYGSAVGVDLTRRDLQAVAKSSGRPWDVSKGFDQSAPISLIRPGSAPDHGLISLHVNGEQRQSGDLNQMIWSTSELLSHLTHLFRLEAGDLIFTGTPAGVGPIVSGDQVEAKAADLPPLRFKVV